MISHLSIGVRDLARSLAFYDAVMSALGYGRVWTAPEAVGYGYPGNPNEPFAIKHDKQLADAQAELRQSHRSHIAFVATTRERVAAFHAAALQHGGGDDGGPGLRPHYGLHYFAAFVRDPDGYRLEAVCHVPPG